MAHDREEKVLLDETLKGAAKALCFRMGYAPDSFTSLPDGRPGTMLEYVLVTRRREIEALVSTHMEYLELIKQTWPGGNLGFPLSPFKDGMHVLREDGREFVAKWHEAVSGWEESVPRGLSPQFFGVHEMPKNWEYVGYVLELSKVDTQKKEGSENAG